MWLSGTKSEGAGVEANDKVRAIAASELRCRVGRTELGVSSPPRPPMVCGLRLRRHSSPNCLYLWMRRGMRAEMGEVRGHSAVTRYGKPVALLLLLAAVALGLAAASSVFQPAPPRRAGGEHQCGHGLDRPDQRL